MDPNYRDLGGFYSQVLREMKLDPIDVIGFSAGGYIAAEMLAADQRIFSKAVLVAPMGIRPEQGEIFDIFPITVRAASAGDGGGSRQDSRICQDLRR